NCTLADAIENIDIGGPTMVRAAAKNNAYVGIVTNPADYHSVIANMDANNGALTDAFRFDLAIKAFEHTAAYDGAIANYFCQKVEVCSKNYHRSLYIHIVKEQNFCYFV